MSRALDKITEAIQSQIRKHGQYRGWGTVEEVVNSLTNYELLELICDHLDQKEE